jgi:carboxypeptidase Taq
MSLSAYQNLENSIRRIGLIGEAGAILGWDASAMMPDGGAKARGDQLAELRALAHSIMVGSEMADLINAAKAEDELDAWQTRNLDLIHRQWIRATAIPEDLVVAFSKACSECETRWRQARADDDFAAVLPYTETVLDLARKAGTAKSEKLGLGLYDTMLDEFDPGQRSTDIDVVFGDLADWLPGFLDDVLARQGSTGPGQPLAGPFPIEAQKTAGHKFMKALGFNFDNGRLDISLHPFCGGTPDDVRITTRYDEDDLSSAMMGVLHETGHALYEQGLPSEWRRQPVGEALGMSMHESQSLLIEMQVCRSLDFFTYAAPILKEAYASGGGEDAENWSADNLHRLNMNVERGFIRVDADEVTYPAHVILRYRLEKALIEGHMNLKDLPGEWNNGMQELLGVTPPTDTLGCLQDIHWYDGAWGYFPTYTLGAMTAAQIFQAAKQQKPEITQGIRTGNFKPLVDWLRGNIHSKGSSQLAKELLTEITGEPLNAEIFKNHLKRRYLGA